MRPRRPTVLAQPETTGSARALRAIGSFLGPTAVLTGLLFFFGRQHAYSLFDYFGVPLSVMGLTTEDYLVRSEDGLLGVLALVMAGVLILLWFYRFVRGRLSDAAWARVLRLLIPAAVFFGLAGVAVTTVALVDQEAFARSYSIPGSSLAVGVLSLVCASRLQIAHSGRAVPSVVAIGEWVAAFVLISAGLFWAVSDYSTAVGLGRALEIEAALPSRPDAVLYSAKSLSLRAPGVRETVCQAPDAAYRFRYDGLKLLLQSGGQFLFLPEGWNRADGVAIVLPRSDAVRIEFTTGADPNAHC